MRNEAISKLERMREYGISDTAILDYIIVNYLSGQDACDTMASCEEEFGIED